MDFFYLGIVLVLFVATAGVLKVCEWLANEKHGERL
jgi:hypothetical protein